MMNWSATVKTMQSWQPGNSADHLFLFEEDNDYYNHRQTIMLELIPNSAWPMKAIFVLLQKIWPQS